MLCVIFPPYWKEKFWFRTPQKIDVDMWIEAHRTWKYPCTMCYMRYFHVRLIVHGNISLVFGMMYVRVYVRSFPLDGFFTASDRAFFDYFRMCRRNTISIKQFDVHFQNLIFKSYSWCQVYILIWYTVYKIYYLNCMIGLQ